MRQVLVSGGPLSEELVQKYRNVFSTSDGQDVLKDLAKRVEFNFPSYRLGAPVNDCIFFDGQKDLYAFILKTVETKLVESEK